MVKKKGSVDNWKGWKEKRGGVPLQKGEAALLVLVLVPVLIDLYPTAPLPSISSHLICLSPNKKSTKYRRLQNDFPAWDRRRILIYACTYTQATDDVCLLRAAEGGGVLLYRSRAQQGGRAPVKR
jgi:hypothetical protein